MTAVSLRDLYGNPVSSASRVAVDAYDHGVRGLLGFSADIIDGFRSAREADADPDFVLARAALAVSLYLAEKIPEGRAEMDKAAAAAATLPLPERRHVEALTLWVAGRASHGQREVFHDTLLEAALRAGEPERARPLLERRLAKRPNPGRHWIEARG